MIDEYVKWCDTAVSARLYKPVDPEHIALSGAKAKTFMGFFEGIVHKLCLYELKTNPPKPVLKEKDKVDDEEQMRRTGDYNEIDFDSSKRKVRIQSSFKDEENGGNIQFESSTRQQIAGSSREKGIKIKKMTEDVQSGLMIRNLEKLS